MMGRRSWWSLALPIGRSKGDGCVWMGSGRGCGWAEDEGVYVGRLAVCSCTVVLGDDTLELMLLRLLPLLPNTCDCGVCGKAGGSRRCMGLVGCCVCATWDALEAVAWDPSCSATCWDTWFTCVHDEEVCVYV